MVEQLTVNCLSNDLISTSVNKTEEMIDVDEQKSIKKAKNAAAARKTRSRKKAYVNDLEAKLRKQDEQIAQLIESEIKANSYFHSTTDITNFTKCYKEWSSTFDYLIMTLQRQMAMNNSDAYIEPILKIINDNYIELLHRKKQSAKTCVMSIINVTWMPQALSCVMWIGGIRPSDIVTLILNHVEMYNNQGEKIQMLKQTTIAAENIISTKLDLLKKNISQNLVSQSFINIGNEAAVSNFHNKMCEQIGKLYTMQNYLSEADNLRANTFSELRKILYTKQSAFAVFTIHQHIKRLESWNNLWETTPKLKTNI